MERQSEGERERGEWKNREKESITELERQRKWTRERDGWIQDGSQREKFV